MVDRHRPEPDPGRLADTESSRLLARASELDAAGMSGADLKDLRAAALEAGISPVAFDAALAEMQGAQDAQLPAVPLRRRAWPRVVVALAAVLAFTLLMRSSPSQPAVPMIEQTVLLRCLSPGEAAELVRPLLGTNGVVLSNANSPRVLRVRGSAEQIQQVRAMLDRYEVSASACSKEVAPAPVR